MALKPKQLSASSASVGARLTILKFKGGFYGQKERDRFHW
jgi:hypothetical protein